MSEHRIEKDSMGEVRVPAKAYYAAQTQPNAGFKTAVQGNQVNVVAPPPKLNPVATKQPPVTKQLAKAQVDRGWQNVPAAQAQQLKQKFAQQAPPPANLPPKPAPVFPAHALGMPLRSIARIVDADRRGRNCHINWNGICFRLHRHCRWMALCGNGLAIGANSSARGTNDGTWL